MVCMQCSWITNHFNYFIPSFWRIKFSSTNFPRVKRLTPWRVSIRMSTSLLIRYFSLGLFFGYEPIWCPSLTPQKLHPLGSLVNTPFANTFFHFVAVLPHLEAWYGSFLQMKHQPLDIYWWSDVIFQYLQSF